MELENYRKYSKMARGLEKADLVFKNAQVFLSQTGEFVEGDVAVSDGKILGWDLTMEKKKLTLQGKLSVRGLLTVIFIWSLRL